MNILQGLDIETGVDLAAVIAAGGFIYDTLGHCCLSRAACAKAADRPQ